MNAGPMNAGVMSGGWRGGAILRVAAFVLAVGAFLAAMIGLGGGRISPAPFAATTLLAAIATAMGAWLLRAGGLVEVRAWLPASFVAGLAVISVPMVPLATGFGMRAMPALGLVILVLAPILAWAARGRRRAAPPGLADVAVVIVAALAIGWFGRLPIASHASMTQTGILPIWNDYIVHGVSIASFGGRFADGTDLEVTGEARVFYHYAPFMIPAALQRLSGLDGIAASTALLLPLGLLAGVLGFYALAVELAGRAGGFLITAIAFCVPAYLFPVQSGWFDFHWLLFIAPGSGLGLGVCALVCIALLTWLRGGGTRALVLTWGLLAAVTMVRAHFLLLLAPPVAAVTAIRLHRVTRWLFVAGAGLAAAVAAAVMAVPALRERWAAWSSPRLYAEWALQWSPVFGFMVPFEGRSGLPVLAAGVVVSLLATAGAYALLYPLAQGWKIRRRGRDLADLLVPVMVLTFIGLMLFAPAAANADHTEYKHRHFLLLYLTLALWTGAHVWTLASSTWRHPGRIGYGVGFALLALTAVIARDVNPARPNVAAMPWAKEWHDQRIIPGIHAVAAYLGAHSRRGDRIASPSARNGDPRALVMQLSALTSLPALLGRSDMKATRSACMRGETQRRLAILDEIAAAPDWEAARQALLGNGIRWYILGAGETTRWADAASPAFTERGIRVYDAGSPSTGHQARPRC